MDTGFTAVIVDSEELFGLGLKSILARDRSRLRARYCTSIDGALQWLEGDPNVLLAVFDVNVAGMDRGVLELVRRECPATRVMLAALRARRSEILEYLGWGAHGVILKTQSSHEIAAAVRLVMSGGVFVPAAATELDAARIDGNRSAPDGTGADGGELHPEHASVAADLSKAFRLGLSSRQSTILRLLAAGLSNKAIARELGLAEGTVKVHVNSLYKALKVRNRASAAATYTANGVGRLNRAVALCAATSWLSIPML